MRPDIIWVVRVVTTLQPFEPQWQTVSWLVPETSDATNSGSGWRRHVINQCLESVSTSTRSPGYQGVGSDHGGGVQFKYGGDVVAVGDRHQTVHLHVGLPPQLGAGWVGCRIYIHLRGTYQHNALREVWKELDVLDDLSWKDEKEPSSISGGSELLSQVVDLSYCPSGWSELLSQWLIFIVPIVDLNYCPSGWSELLSQWLISYCPSGWSELLSQWLIWVTVLVVDPSYCPSGLSELLSQWLIWVTVPVVNQIYCPSGWPVTLPVVDQSY